MKLCRLEYVLMVDKSRRKNWLFTNTQKGAEASAMLYSIIETAKANGLILYEYLLRCMKELANPQPDIESLLPWNFSY